MSEKAQMSPGEDISRFVVVHAHFSLTTDSFMTRDE